MEPRRIVFLAGLAGTWFRPRRTGPHLTAGSWASAVCAHLLGLASVGIFALLVMLPEGKDAPLSPEAPWVLLAILLSIEAAMLGVALILMPWAAAGETTRALYARCLKWTWRTSSLAMPVLTGLLGMASLESWLQDVSFEGAFDFGGGPAGVPFFTMATYLCCWWLMWVLLGGLVDYAGPPEGPGWEPIEAICEGCGYRLAFLRRDAVCPECAKPVSESLAEGAAEPSGGGPTRARLRRGFFSLTLAMLRAAPLRKNAPRSEMGPARRFAAISLLLMLIPLHATVPTTAAVYDRNEPILFWIILAPVVGALFASILLQLWAAGLLVFVEAVHRQDKKRDPRVAASTALYGSALLWPLVILSQGFLVGMFVMDHLYSQSGSGRQVVLLGMTPFQIAQGCAAVLTATVLLWWVLRVRTHVRSVRYTNS